MKVSIVGGGGFGGALARVFLRAGHDVTLMTRDMDRLQWWRAKHCLHSPKYPWLSCIHCSDQPEGIDGVRVAPWSHDVSNFDFLVLAVPTDALMEVCGDIEKSGTLDWEHSVVTLVQKGLVEEIAPMHAVRGLFPNAVSMTGAAFSKDLAKGAQVEMIISATTQSALGSTKELLKGTVLGRSSRRLETLAPRLALPWPTVSGP